MNTKKSIIRNYLLLSLGAGVAMGVIFPFFAGIFTVYKQSSYRLPFMISCIIAGVLVGVISFFIGKITLIHAMRRFFKTFSAIAEGDLTTRCELESNDELGRLSEDFNLFIQRLQQIFRNNQESADRTLGLSEKLAETAEASERASKEIVDGTAELAEGAVLQSEQLSEIKSKMGHSSHLVREGYQCAEKMLNTSVEAVRIAGEGNQEMTQVVAQFEWVSKTIEFATESIQNLDKRSAEIGNIVEVITGIASQTNLLALNAAIEAARAGEAGKGFAVVAEEIRGLSDRSGEAAKSISNLIGDTQAETTVTVQSMESNLKKINMQLSGIQNSVKALGAVVGKVKDTEGGAREALEVYERIKTMYESVDDALAKISSVMDSNAKYSQEIAAGASEQYGAVKAVNDSAEQMTGLAAVMKEDIRRFRT